MEAPPKIQEIRTYPSDSQGGRQIPPNLIAPVCFQALGEDNGLQDRILYYVRRTRVGLSIRLQPWTFDGSPFDATPPKVNRLPEALRHFLLRHRQGLRPC